MNNLTEQLREFTIESEERGIITRIHATSAAKALYAWKNTGGWDKPWIGVTAQIVPIVYTVPVDPADATGCEGCQ